VIEDGHVRLTVGPRENGHRPAVDVLFRSAAAQRRDGVVGVVLSGTRDDGAAGLAAIKSEGGVAIVQDPDDALYAGMPANALAHVSVDAVVPLTQIAETVVSIVKGEAPASIGEKGGPGGDSRRHPELTSVCPECGGVLTERHQAGMPQWECHVGHRYSPRSLVDAQGQRVEMALWTAVRMLRDRSALLRRMADHAESRHQPRSARSFRSQAQDASDQAELVLDALKQAAATTLQAISDGEDEPKVTAEQAG
jgi:two-component system chemotaxis response regulator CheB